MVGVLGVAVLRLSDRLGPGEDADLLAARRARTSRSPGLAVRRRAAIVRHRRLSARRTNPSPTRRLHNSRSRHESRNRHSSRSSPCSAPRRSPPAPAAPATARPRTQTVAPPVVACRAVAAVEQPIARFIRATGTLMAEEQADVAAETAGRVVATPIERGTPVAAGRRADSHCRRPKPTRSSRKPKPTPRRSKRGSASPPASAFDVNAVPEVQNAKASLRPGAERVRPHQVAARPARRLAVGVRPAPHAGGSGAAAVRGGEERRRAAVPGAAGGARPRRARAQGARRHRRPRAVHRRRRASGSSRSATTSPRA